MRGRAAPPHPRIYRVPPPPGGITKSASPTFIITLSLGPLAFSREEKLDGRLNDTHVSYTDRLIAFLKLFDSIIFSFSTWNH